MTGPERSRPQNRTPRRPVVRLPRRPVPLGPETAAALQALADRYAAYYADPPEVIEQRRRVLAEAAQDQREQATTERRAWERAIRAAQTELATDARTAA